MGDYKPRHFDTSEFACKCGCRQCKMDDYLLQGLDRLRDRVDSRILVRSGFRCQTHNASVGGKPTSRHLFGEAADIWCPERTQAALLKEVKALSKPYGPIMRSPWFFGGIGVYPKEGFIHVDMRGIAYTWIFLDGEEVEF